MQNSSGNMDKIKLLFHITYSSIIILLFLILQFCSEPYAELDSADPIEAGFPTSRDTFQISQLEIHFQPDEC